MKIKALIVKISILGSLIILMYVGAAYNLSQNFVDSYYHKFTYKSGSLIIGLSRGIYGVTPEVIEEEFNQEINKPVLNFAFDRVQSPYGDILLKAIKHKIDTTSSNGLFILSVSPASFFISNKINEENVKKIDEDKYLDRMTKFNMNPNFEYIRKCYDGSLYRGFIGSPENIRKSHTNGWIEFKEGFGSYKVSETQIKGWKEENFLGYLKVGENQIKSEYRISKFEQTITYLKKHGKVVLVRLPLDKDFVDLENNFWKNFDNEMATISENQNVPYLNYTTASNTYETFDGSHLFGYSAKLFTKKLCDDIKNK
ncbi:hypothetical protein [Urechidicola croceus]|uniref:DUF1574 domain-containing protein n=1 Tax=Urechidicola croceus TaxID=1850246 RepID=A0A1D8PB03_9FLAO|nr:hypothetical protein [Urechidicola croceus]AOW21717.1 hypothetical protein LPB138_13950 [Urechidicola croceus]